MAPSAASISRVLSGEEVTGEEDAEDEEDEDRKEEFAMRQFLTAAMNLSFSGNNAAASLLVANCNCGSY